MNEQTQNNRQRSRFLKIFIQNPSELHVSPPDEFLVTRNACSDFVFGERAAFTCPNDSHFKFVYILEANKSYISKII